MWARGQAHTQLFLFINRFHYVEGGDAYEVTKWGEELNIILSTTKLGEIS